MVSFNLLVAVSLGYVVFLFAVAFVADRSARRGRLRLLHSPLVYTLSLSIYATAWTFYGAVGYAARSGLEYLTIYLGPTLVFVGWWWFLRKLVRVGRLNRITSIADLISSRYGKSPGLAVLVTVLAVVGTTPYIALQLQSVTLSFAVFAATAAGGGVLPDRNATALLVAAGLALFTVLFGTRNLDANERHHGVVTAIAVEAVVKLVALLAVGVFVVWGVAGGAGDVLARISASPIATMSSTGGRWVALIFLSATAIITLPRMFQVLVVENSHERHLSTAAWAFPLYLMLISLFVVPIAVVGLAVLPKGSNPDLFVLTVPLSLGHDNLAMLAFLGGFSSATSMVIVAAIALSTMVSNHIVMPLWLWWHAAGGASMSGDVRKLVLRTRRISIAAVLLLGYTYFRVTGGTEALASIGLISFAGVAQALPALIGGLYWRGATRRGAVVGLCAGFAIWAYTMFLPSFEGQFLPAALMTQGPFGIGWLRPHALFGFDSLDPLLNALFWSIGLNTGLFILVSLVTFPSPLERLQGAQFVNVFDRNPRPGGWVGGSVESEDLLVMAQRIMGAAEAQTLFQASAREQGKAEYLPDPTPEFLERLERELAGSVGAATAHAMVGRMTGGTAVSVQDLLAVADETAQMMEHSSQLEAKSRELGRTARKLRDANAKLTELSVQKDAFLSQVSHELRTPMTSIRAFSQILEDADRLPPEMIRKFSIIIQDESIRLTRLLDDLLDLSVLESGTVVLNVQTGNLVDVIDRAVSAASRPVGARELLIRRERTAENVTISTDTDRLRQVFINLLTNAAKYCAAPVPELRIAVSAHSDRFMIDFIDNGSGIVPKRREIIFEKFSRLSDQASAGSAGLGLAICRELMAQLGGSVSYLPGQSGTAFRVILPRHAPTISSQPVPPAPPSTKS